MSTPTAAAAGNQRQRHGEVARRGAMAPSREDSDIRAPPAGTRYAVAYVASVDESQLIFGLTMPGLNGVLQEWLA